MDSASKRDKKNATQNKLKKAVDWKIFEVQSVLISEDVAQADVEESLLWLQPRHFTDIVEERVNDGRCGFPLCKNDLHGSNACYRIDYKEKKIYSVEISNNYCSVECIEKAQILEKKYDSSVPYSRSVTRSLDLSAPASTGIDEVLSLLSPHPSAASKNSSKSAVGFDEQDLPPLPIHKSSVLAETGELAVHFENGIPVPVETVNMAQNITPADIVPRLDAMVLSDDVDDAYDDVNESTVDVESSMEVVDAVAAKPPPPQVSAIYRKVYVNAPSPAVFPPQQVQSEQVLGEEDSQVTHSTAATTATTATAPPLFSPKRSSGIPGSASTGQGRGTSSISISSEGGMSMAEMFATMNALRVKHNLENPSTTPTVRKPNRFVDGSLLGRGREVEEEAAAESGEKERKERKLNNPHEKISGAGCVVPVGVRAAGQVMGRRPGPKTVSWGQNQVHVTTATDIASDAASDQPGSSAGSSNHTADDVTAATATVVEVRPVIKSPAISSTSMSVMEKAPKQVEPMRLGGGKRTAHTMQQMQLGGQVMERANPQVLSEAAILRKREATDDAVSPAMEVVFGNGEGEEGEHWVDVDPSELAGMVTASSSAESAMSIEGYVANVKRTMRVSPATTIKNLSHSPYTYSQPADNQVEIEAGTGVAGPDSEAMSEGGGGDEEAEDDGGAGADSWGTEEAEEEQEEEEPWSDEDTGGEPMRGTANADAAPGKSMFLAVWSTMDALFGGGSLGSVFSDAPPQGQQRQQQQQQASSGVAFQQEQKEQEHETTRMPLALEQQNAQHAFVKLLLRGLQAAESRMDLFKMYLNLPEERMQYQAVKHRLIAAAGASLQIRSNLQQQQSVGASSFGGGLLSHAWTLIGLLIVDAIVVKKQLGPLRRPKHSASTITSSQATPSTNNISLGGGLRGGDVSLEGWARVVEEQAGQVLRAGSNPNLGKLREGDLNILRSYFDYV